MPGLGRCTGLPLLGGTPSCAGTALFRLSRFPRGHRCPLRPSARAGASSPYPPLWDTHLPLSPLVQAGGAFCLTGPSHPSHFSKLLWPSMARPPPNWCPQVASPPRRVTGCTACDPIHHRRATVGAAVFSLAPCSLLAVAHRYLEGRYPHGARCCQCGSHKDCRRRRHGNRRGGCRRGTVT